MWNEKLDWEGWRMGPGFCVSRWIGLRSLRGEQSLGGLDDRGEEGDEDRDGVLYWQGV